MSRLTVPIFIERVPGRANVWRAHAGVTTSEGASPLLAARKAAATYFGATESRVALECVGASTPARTCVHASLKPESSPVAWGMLVAFLACAGLAVLALSCLTGCSSAPEGKPAGPAAIDPAVEIARILSMPLTLFAAACCIWAGNGRPLIVIQRVKEKRKERAS